MRLGVRLLLLSHKLSTRPDILEGSCVLYFHESLIIDDIP